MRIVNFIPVFLFDHKMVRKNYPNQIKKLYPLYVNYIYVLCGLSQHCIARFYKTTGLKIMTYM